MKKEQFNRNTIAMVYEFDGTLSPQLTQKYTVLPKLVIKGWLALNRYGDGYNFNPITQCLFDMQKRHKEILKMFQVI